MTKHKEYALALFSLTEEEGTTEAVYGEMELLAQLLTENPDYIKLMDTPSVTLEEKLSLIDKAIGGLNISLINLFKILTERHIVYIFPKIQKEYINLYNESRGIVLAEAITAAPMTEEQKARLTATLGVKLNKKIVLKNTVDSTILGGIKLRYSGIQYDSSLRSRLDRIERGLKNTII